MIFPILLLALILRLIHINQSLWLDEAIGAIAARDFSYTGILFDFLRADNHPPLYYLTLKFWSSIFGYSEISLRSLSVLFGVLTVYLTFQIAKKISDNKFFALLAALLIASSPLHVYYSQEVRMYPMITLIAAGLVYVFLLLNEKPTQIWLWVEFSILLLLAAASDYITIFLFPVFFLYGFLNKKQIQWYLFLTAGFIPSAIAFVWWLPVFLTQIQGGQVVLTVLPAWKDLAGGATFKQAVLFWNKFILGRISLESKTTYYLLLGISSLPITAALFNAFRNLKKVQIIWLWLLVPVVLGFLGSFFIPAFIYFRFIYVLPAFYILIAWGIFQLKNSGIQKMLTGAILAVNLTGLGIYYFDTNQLREDWKGAVNFVELRAGQNEAAVFEFPEAFAPVRWYRTGKVETVGVTDRIFADPEKTRQKTMAVLEEKNGVYYFSYLKDLSDPTGIVEKTLVGEGFKKVEVTNFRNIGQVSHYVKEKL